VIIVGLDNSGKSTLINWLKPKAQQQDSLAATVGF
jgi:ribosome biogenesis GTPase A